MGCGGGPCYCTGACRPCDHSFVWNGVIPPSHCPKCGADIRPKCPCCGKPYQPNYGTWCGGGGASGGGGGSFNITYGSNTSG